jgi:hypothetical protein
MVDKLAIKENMKSFFRVLVEKDVESYKEYIGLV